MAPNSDNDNNAFNVNDSGFVNNNNVNNSNGERPDISQIQILKIYLISFWYSVTFLCIDI